MVRPILCVAVLLAGLACAAHAATLTVIVTGVRDDRGHIRIGVCNKAEFLSETCRLHAVVPSRKGSVTASIAGVPPGQYAVAVYQDRDDSGRLKRNFLGLPQEDLGFSRNPALTFGPPSFTASALGFGSGDSDVAVMMHGFGP